MHDRRFGIGAELSTQGVSFRVFADRATQVRLHVEGASARDMEAEGDGYHSLFVPGLRAGARYGFILDGQKPLPDPASRAQPDGPHGLSEVVDPSVYRWQDETWRGSTIHNQVIYEMHVGTFTPEGTWRAAIDKLPHLRDVGISLIEMMPVNCFPGRFGWGYDGVTLFAPVRLYGEPDDLRAFVDAAHRLGIGVILDVVYNHLGPDGNYLSAYSSRYFTDKYDNEWGDALNFEGEDAPMREYVIENARYWIQEFHFDGLRIDATQSILDASNEHVISELVRACRAATSRRLVMIGENEPQHARLMRPIEDGGSGLDGLWNDDYHHSALVAATAHSEAYFEDHAGRAQEFVSAAKHGFLFQGQIYAHQSQRRGEPALSEPGCRFISFIENHDQLANSGHGRRVHQATSPGRHRALTALTLLSPATPMLFQGQEFSASAHFFYFADHGEELARAVAKGRADFLSQFESLATPEMRDRLAPPHELETFQRCKLDWSEARTHAAALALHKDLIALRRAHPAIHGCARNGVDGSTLTDQAFLLRFFGADGADLLFFVNLGRDLHRRSIPDPLVAPPQGRRWSEIWSSEDPKYGGGGRSPIERPDGWRIPGEAAVMLRADQ